MENETHENLVETRFVGETLISFETDSRRPAGVGSDLDEPRWSVVSFDKREAGGLKYDEALDVMSELDSHNVRGLCLVTDEAGQRSDG